MSGFEDFVRQNALMLERITIERAFLRIPDEIVMNPHRKVHVLADNPTSRKSPEATAVDPSFIEANRNARLEPMKKYPIPVTESHEIGWKWAPQIQNPECFHRRRQTDVTQNYVFPTKEKDSTKEKDNNKKK